MKAYWVNAKEQAVHQADYANLADLQRMVGGHIELAKQWSSGDVLFVDEEGLLKKPAYGFKIAGLDQPFAGNGVMVGREIGDTAETNDPDMTIDELREKVSFGVYFY